MGGVTSYLISSLWWVMGAAGSEAIRDFPDHATFRGKGVVTSLV